MKHNYGIDILKIIACLQVVALHCFVIFFNGTLQNDNLDKLLSNCIYVSATTAIPFFFLINGYFVLNKSEVTYNYWLYKTKSIIFIIFGWIFIYNLKDVVKGHVTFFKYLKGTFVPGIPLTSTFIHFWFFWSLIIMIFLAIWLSKFLRTNFKLYEFILIILVLINVSINALSYVYNFPIEESILQPFRITTWLMYYMLGGFIGKYKYSIEQFTKKNFFKLCTVTVLLYSLFIFVAYKFHSLMGTYYTEYNYDNLILIVVSVLLFILISSLNLDSKKNTCISKMESLSLGIYVMHPFILKKVFLVINGKTIMDALAAYICTVLIAAVLTYIISKNKYTRKLIKL